jgi:hypothetical protein
MAKQVNDKVIVRVPIDPLNPQLKTETVIINGHFYEIERGKDVEVPNFVKDVLVKGNRI